MSTSTLANGVTVPTLFDDSPRTRFTDPLTSHMAADQSSKYLSVVKQRILHLFEVKGPMTDSELGEAYMVAASMSGWELLRPDTPRKRRSDLVSDGWLVATGDVRANKFGAAEQVWGLA